MSIFLAWKALFNCVFVYAICMCYVRFDLEFTGFWCIKASDACWIVHIYGKYFLYVFSYLSAFTDFRTRFLRNSKSITRNGNIHCFRCVIYSIENIHWYKEFLKNFWNTHMKIGLYFKKISPDLKDVYILSIWRMKRDKKMKWMRNENSIWELCNLVVITSVIVY